MIYNVGPWVSGLGLIYLFFCRPAAKGAMPGGKGAKADEDDDQEDYKLKQGGCAKSEGERERVREGAGEAQSSRAAEAVREARNGGRESEKEGGRGQGKRQEARGVPGMRLEIYALYASSWHAA